MQRAVRHNSQSGSDHLIETARMALPLMSPDERAEAEALITDLSGSDTARADRTAAAAAFESDMQPVCNAVVEALQAGDLHALKGLRAMLPHLLGEVNESPALADVLAHQMGKALLDGFKGTEEKQ